MASSKRPVELYLISWEIETKDELSHKCSLHLSLLKECLQSRELDPQTAPPLIRTILGNLHEDPETAVDFLTFPQIDPREDHQIRPACPDLLEEEEEIPSVGSEKMTKEE
ncbi:hypothetical protein M407DRAFT_29261 [Tulasnella calospora MUT 4182]|uniref:Uncharacterized protein n=1 Tax=Tulasnella calospora MUT 4182 TaxID=1051891 RepID=A0A0C3LI39_9AGAM|nr:hypothetical protein M407DRAFT_29261 [Tulasnella calospora MUT 4182]